MLGVSYADLGSAVAKEWNLPNSIIESIRGVPPGRIAIPESEEEKLRDFAVFANEFCDLFQCYQQTDIEFAMGDLLKRFKPSISLEPEYCQKLIAAGFEKLKEYAPIFEINVA